MLVSSDVSYIRVLTSFEEQKMARVTATRLGTTSSALNDRSRHAILPKAGVLS